MKIFLLKSLILSIAFVMVGFFYSSNIFAQTQMFSNPANNGMPANMFNIPTGVTKVTVEIWGGGGAGGGCTNNNNNSGGGGGGGTFTLAGGVAVTSAVPVTVGAGGLGVLGGNGSPGMTSIFNSPVPKSAVGGSFGIAGNAANVNLSGAGGAATAGITFGGGAGSAGQGSSGNNNGFGGAGGGGAGNGGTGGNAVLQTPGAGGIAAPFFGIPGGTGAASQSDCANGISATGLAAGGGGAHNQTPSCSSPTAQRTGGNGAHGRVVVRYIVITPGSIAPCYATASAAEAAALAATTASDDCNGPITLTVSSTGGSCNLMVTVTATNPCGSESKTTYSVGLSNGVLVITTAAMDQTVECDGSGNIADLQNWLESQGGAEANSGCTISWTNNYEGLSDDCGATGSATVTFTGTDNCGNTVQTTATFTIEDTTNPSIDEAAENMTVECDGAGNVAELNAWLADNGGAEASDICSGVVWDNDFMGLSDDCGATGSATVTFSVTDDCGNTSYTTATFTIEDTTNPSIDEAAEDMTVECDGAGNVAELNAWLADNGGAEASDICSGVVWDNDFDGLSDDCGATGSATVTFSATDDCGNTSYTTATFTIEDTTNPSIDEAAEDMTVECDGAGNVAELNAWLADNGGAEASDICSGVVWDNDFDGLSDDCGATGSATVTFSATDDCGNTSYTTATFTIEDTTNPSIDEAAEDMTVECDGAGNVAELNAWLADNGGAEASDICSGVVWDNDFDGLSDDCGATGSATVTFSATDDCGNTSYTTATFTIEDTTNPSIDEAAEDMTVECDGAGNVAELNAWLADNGGAEASDICSGVVWDNDFDGLSDDCGATGSATVTFSATDDCGNTSYTTATFTIEDTTNPSIDEAAEDMTVECDGAGNVAELNAWLADNGGAEASDICSGVVWDNDFMGLSDDCGATGSATVTFSATDDCGNTSYTTATFTIEDTTNPSIDEAAEDMTVECDGAGNVAELNAWLADNGGAEASDICSGVVWDNDFMGLSDDCGATGSATVTFSATDDCGNTSYTTATFTIEDTTNPSIDEAAEDMTVECDGAGNVAELNAWLADNGGAEASDICSGVVWDNDFMGLSDDCGATGSATVTFSATDDCGNTSYTTATFTIEDTTNPSIDEAAEDMTVECDGAGNVAELNAWLADNGGAEASDICSGVVWDNDFMGLSDDCGATGSATVTFSATDDCGNTSYTTATFTIEDTTNPSIDEAAEDMTVECDGAGNVAELNAWLADNGGAEASDICSGVVWDNDFMGLSDDCGATGSATVTFSATDDCGNTSYTTATFTIEDTTNPSIDEGAEDMTVECDGAGNVAELNAWLADNGGAEASDICSGVVWDNDFDGLSDDCGATGSATVTFSATDDCGNTSYTTATFTIEDTTNPSIDEAAEDMTVECDGAGNVAELNAWLADNGGAEASDICSGVVWDNDFDGLSDDCGATGSATVTFSATDDCGNTSYTTSTFSIADTQPPVWSDIPEDFIVECDGSDYSQAYALWIEAVGNANVSDLCSSVDISVDVSEFTDGCGLTGSAMVTFTATDECDNSSQVTANFIIEDTTPPTAVCKNVMIEWDEFGHASIDANDIDDGSSDACGEITIEVSETEFDCANLGENIVTLTVTDECGNSSMCTAIVTVAIPAYAICGNNNDKVLICHYPPGNPENLETICINTISLCDHLQHPGDHIGACGEGIANNDDPGLGLTFYGEESTNHVDSHIHAHDEAVIEGKINKKLSVYSQPNPFNSQTTIYFDLNGTESVSLRVFNNVGQIVATLVEDSLDAGKHAYVFDATNLPDGLFYYFLNTGKEIESGRMLFVR